MPQPPKSPNPNKLPNYSVQQSKIDKEHLVQVPAGQLVAAGSFVALTLNDVSTASSATTGAASALPTDPAGYLMIVVGGAVMKLPYYNV